MSPDRRHALRTLAGWWAGFTSPQVDTLSGRAAPHVLGTQEGAPTSGRPWRSIRVRIVASVALLTTVGLAGAGIAAFVVERRNIDVRVDDALRQEIFEFRELAEQGVDPETGSAFDDPERLMTIALARNVPSANELLVGYLPDATVVSASENDTLSSDLRFEATVTATREPGFGDYRTDTGETVRYATMPVVYDGIAGHYVVAYFVDREIGEFGYAVRTYVLAGIATVLAVAAAALTIAGRVIRPVREVRDAADAISETELSTRIPVRGHDEVADLATTFNAMLDRIESAWSAQRRMLDDAGHELRTPITIVRGHLEVVDPHDAEDVETTRALVLDELTRMNLIVDDLLVLANANRPDFLRRSDILADELVASVLDKAVGMAERRWTHDAMTDVVIRADPSRLTQALLQLAANACAVTTTGDEIGLGCSQSAGNVSFWVRDCGPGVPPADRERIFERFNRGSHPAGEGTGLGLSIVAAIAEAHGGRAHVVPAGPAGGARFIMDIPIGQPSRDVVDRA